MIDGKSKGNLMVGSDMRKQGGSGGEARSGSGRLTRRDFGRLMDAMHVDELKADFLFRSIDLKGQSDNVFRTILRTS